MEIEAQLNREQFIRLSILQHIQRKQFYFYALTCAIVTAVALFQGLYPLLVLAWLPFIIYLGLGVFGALRDGSNEAHPVFLPTTYSFTNKGVTISTPQGTSDLPWNYFSNWKMVANSYVLTLKNGSILAIPQSDVLPTQGAKLQALLDKHIKP